MFLKPETQNEKKLFTDVLQKISQNVQESPCAGAIIKLIANKVTALRLTTLKKGDSSTGVFLWILRNI